MSIVLTITDAGRAALVNADHDGTRAVRIASVGVSPTAVAASRAATTLPGEVKRISTISGGASAADVIHLIVRDESSDSYTVRSFALYLGDGTLFAIYGQGDPIIEKSRAALLLLAIDATLIDLAASQVTFGNANFLNPAATTETPGVVELATDAEAAALADSLRALTPKAMGAIFTAANILSRLLQADGAGSGLDADLLDGRHASDFALLSGASFSGPVTAYLRGTGAAELAPSAGAGVELQFAGGEGYVLSYDRSARTYRPLSMVGQSIILSAQSGGLTFFGTGMTRNGATVWDAGSDGAGSGLDADLLDGRHASDFALLSGASFSGPVTAYLRGTGAADLAPPTGAGVELQYTGGAGYVVAYDRDAGTARPLSMVGQTITLTAQAGSVAVSATGLTRNGATVWDAGSDGAGSGLDADLLDGRHASDFALLSGASFSGPVTAYLRGTGAADLAPPTGAGVELQYTGGAGYVVAYDRDAGTARPLSMVGQTITLTAQAGSVAVSATGLTRNGATVWDAGSDGAGSGLDADLLDGQQGSWYTDIAARLGYVPLNAASYTALDIRTKLLTVDGAGSGVDADLLDGRHASDFALLSGASFSGPVTAYLRGTGAADLAPPTGAGVELQYTGGAGYVVAYDRDAGTARPLSMVGQTITLTAQAGPVAVSATGMTRNGATVWDAGSDGAGSGLDADLLDGQQGSWYTDIAARLGYAPLNAASYTASDIRTKLLTVDGAGSGVDADLLDGRHASDFALLSGASFSGPVTAYLRGTGAADLAPPTGAGVELQYTGGAGYVVAYDRDAGTARPLSMVGQTITLTAQAGPVAVSATGMTRNGATVWDAGSDGAGSGLDADLLDGWHRDDIRRWANLLDLPASFPPGAHTHAASDLAPAFASHSFAADGYQVLPGGLILQWCTGGMVSSGLETTQTLTFPITFPTACLQASVSTQLDIATTAGDAFFQIAGAPSSVSVTVQRQYTGGGRDERPSAPRVFAIGY